MLRKLFLFLSFAALGLVGCDQHPTNRIQPKQGVIPAGEIGSRLPVFSVKDLQGRKISWLTFAAKWCSSISGRHGAGRARKRCQATRNSVDRYGSRGFAVIGFKFDIMKDTEDPALFAKKIGVRYPLAIASDDLKRKFGGIEGLPTTMLYDRQGVLRKKIIGFEYTDIFESALKPLL